MGPPGSVCLLSVYADLDSHQLSAGIDRLDNDPNSCFVATYTHNGF